MLENCDKIMHSRFNFDACPMHSLFSFVRLMHQNLRAYVLFCHNSHSKVNMQLLIYKRGPGITPAIRDPNSIMFCLTLLTLKIKDEHFLCFWHLGRLFLSKKKINTNMWIKLTKKSKFKEISKGSFFIMFFHFYYPLLGTGGGKKHIQNGTPDSFSYVSTFVVNICIKKQIWYEKE